MRSANRIILASAGSGKSSTIVSEAMGAGGKKSALITYTVKSSGELQAKFYEKCGLVPAYARTGTWFQFLLQHFVRPYQTGLIDGRVKGISWTNGQSTRGVARHQIDRFFFGRNQRLYSDKVSDFACELIKATDGKPIRRLEQIIDRLYVDEVQDLAGYDLDLIEHLLMSSIDVVLVGDHRQATYKTHQSRRNKGFEKSQIIGKFEDWQKRGLVDIEVHNHSYRCVQSICDFADGFFPDACATQSRNMNETDHDGVFVIRDQDVGEYVARFNPQSLRYDRRNRMAIGAPLNFGESKGMSFNRVLIYPHGPLLKYLKSGKLEDAGKELAKLYVAVTRARQSVAFVVPSKPADYIVPWFENSAPELTDER